MGVKKKNKPREILAATLYDQYLLFIHSLNKYLFSIHFEVGLLPFAEQDLQKNKLGEEACMHMGITAVAQTEGH